MYRRLPITNWARKRVWIVGASTGIGQAVAEDLRKQGAKVAVSARSADKLRDMVADSADMLALPLDVTKITDVQNAYKTLQKEWSGVDVVIAAAGTHAPMQAHDFDAAQAKKLMDINVNGVFNLADTILPDMLTNKAGHFAIISSVAGYRGLPTALAYGASKAALINFAESLYMDCIDKNVGVHLINPGFVKTPLTDKNDFHMPALISTQEAATHIREGLEKGRFEIHFPKRFTLFLKLLGFLPNFLYFPLVKKGTGL